MMLMFMVCFILIASFNVLNTLVGVLVEVVCATSEGEKRKAVDGHVQETIREIFDKMDENHTGYISCAEFIHMRGNSMVMKALRKLEINEVHFDIFGELLFRSDDVEEPGARPRERNLSFNKLLTMITMLRPGCPASALDLGVVRQKIDGQLANVKARLEDIERGASALSSGICPSHPVRPAAKTTLGTLLPLDLPEAEIRPASPWSSQCSGLVAPLSETVEEALSEAVSLVCRDALGHFVNALSTLKT